MLDQGVDVISVDRDYKPAVNTWGVFDRPKNISKAFGGGRNLTPEDSKMSAAEQRKYDADLKRKLARFRKASGLTVDPAQEARCESLTAQGELSWPPSLLSFVVGALVVRLTNAAAARLSQQCTSVGASTASLRQERNCGLVHAGSVLLDGGRLPQALRLFDEAAALLPVKSSAGGEAALKRAITLDSLGRHDEAKKLYSQLRTHRVTHIAKTARAMSYGFDAGAQPTSCVLAEPGAHARVHEIACRVRNL